MWSFSALSIALLAISASASSIVTVPIKKLQHTGASLKGSLDASRARAMFQKSWPSDGPTTVPARNMGFRSYTTSVGIGNPPTKYTLIIDTGSSNTFCGTGIPYVRTSTSIPTDQNVTVVYGSSNFTGKEFLDQVVLASGLVITNQSIGDALSFFNFPGVDGIIGLGPVGLTRRSLSPDRNATIPTVMNNLVSQGLVKKQVFGVYFAPPTSINNTYGALTYGGTNPDLYEGELTYAPVTETFPSSLFWGVNISSVTYGTNVIIPGSTAGIVDTGTNVILLADDFFHVYMNAIPGAKLDPQIGVIEIPSSSVASMQPLNFLIADQVFTLDVDAQLFPPAVSKVSGKLYGTVAPLGRKSGRGLDFIIGIPFMERSYIVFDADDNRVGFAHTNNTHTARQGY